MTTSGDDVIRRKRRREQNRRAARKCREKKKENVDSMKIVRTKKRQQSRFVRMKSIPKTQNKHIK